MKLVIVTKGIGDPSRLVGIWDFPDTAAGKAAAHGWANDELRRWINEGKATFANFDLEGYDASEVAEGIIGMPGRDPDDTFIYANGGEQIFITALNELL